MNPGTRVSRSAFRLYARHIARYRGYLLGVLASSAVVVGVGLCVPIYLRDLINTVSGAVPGADAAGVLGGILGGILVLWFLDWAVTRLNAIFTMRLTIGMYTDLYTSSFQYLLGHSYNFFVSNFAGSLTHKVSKFAKAFETLFDSIVGHFLPMGFFTLGAIAIVMTRNMVLGAVLLVWTLCFLAFQIYVSRLRQPIRIKRAAADSRMTGNLSDAISNQSTVLLFSGREFESQRFARTVGEWRAALTRTWHADLWIWSGIGLFMIAIQSALLYGGIYYWQRGLFTPGDFVLIQAYLLSIFKSMEQLNREMRRMGDAYSDASEMVQILDTLHEVSDMPNAPSLSVTHGAIAFNHVHFNFHEEAVVFNDFSLHIRGREKVALVGPSGAGKTTVTKLLLRLFDIKSGSIEIDGQNIAEVTQESLRNAVAFVPQEPILFHRTLMENIRYGRRDASDAEVIAAAKKAYCHEFISRLPHGYDTFVGERGVKLSGGERQRVAIARAILKNAPILMLDEATSSLDSASEVMILRALQNLMAGKTVIVIAHRLSTIMKMDRIIALKNGRIVEEGAHQELLQKKGLYASLWSHQAGGFISSA